MGGEWYKKAGKGEDVIFLHGWKSKKETWDGIVALLQDCFTCWTFDLPGFGENPRPEAAWTPMEYARAVLEFTRAQGISHYSVVGHSFGGRVAICLASIEPERVRKLVLYGTMGYREKTSIITRLLLHVYRELGFDRWRSFRESRAFRALQRRIRSEDYAAAGDLRDIFLAALAYDLEPSMTRISQPTLVLHGGHDTIAPPWIAEKIASRIRGAELKIVPEATHYFHLEQPLLFSGIVRKFLA